jgi:hypothetical protein
VLTGPSCGAPYGAADTAGDGDVDEPLGQLATVRGGAVGPQQPTGEVHPVDDEVHLRGEVLARARGDLLREALEPGVQLELVVRGGAARGVLRIVVLTADVGERAAAEAGPRDVGLDGVDDRQQRRPRVVGEALELGVDAGEHGGRLAREVGADQVVLALEQPVDGHLAQTGLADQLVHPHAARAAGGEQPLGGVQDDGLPLRPTPADGNRGIVGGEGDGGCGHAGDAAAGRDGAVRGTPGPADRWLL